VNRICYFVQVALDTSKELNPKEEETSETSELVRGQHCRQLPFVAQGGFLTCCCVGLQLPAWQGPLEHQTRLVDTVAEGAQEVCICSCNEAWSLDLLIKEAQQPNSA
jgi:hypothetical protein